MLMVGIIFPLAKDKDFIIVVDAGHGGKDVGATDNGEMEKNINLGVALQLESLIKKKMKDTKVVMTRDKDVYLTLQQRADVANKAKADLFVSIHTNSVDAKNKNRTTVAGSSVYALGLHKDDNNMQVAQRENSVIELENDFERKYSGFDPSKDESYIIFEMAQKKNLSKSIKLAENIQKELVASGRNDRGVHQAGFWVLWATSMPSVLVELDFICNPDMAKYLGSEKGQKELAEAIFNAINTYHKNWEKENSKLSLSNQNPKTFKEEIAQQIEIEEVTIPAEYAVASTRKNHKSQTSKSEKKSENKTQGHRRRTSQSKSISESQNYEISEIKQKKSYENIAETQVEMASAKEKTDKKADKKKEKEKKDSKKKKEEKKERDRNKHNAKVGKISTVYKIQILASADLLKQNNPRFLGLSPISTYKENDIYKYYYGESTEKEEIEKLLIEVRKKIPDAFIVSTTKSVSTK